MFDGHRVYLPDGHTTTTKVERIGDKGQHAYGLGQPHQHVQLHHPEVLGRLQVQVQIQVQVLILIHIRCRYLGFVTVFDS